MYVLILHTTVRGRDVLSIQGMWTVDDAQSSLSSGRASCTLPVDARNLELLGRLRTPGLAHGIIDVEVF